MKKLTDIYKLIREQETPPMIDPAADEEANVITLIDQLEQLPKVIQQLRSLQLPTSKYKAIKEFARLLGISDDEFQSTMQQMNIISTSESVNENWKETYNKVYDFVKDGLAGYGAWTTSREMEEAVRETFGWTDDIEEAAWEAWNDFEKEN